MEMTHIIGENKKQFEMRHMIDYIQLHEHLTGKPLTELRVDPAFYDWYVEELKKTIKTLGLKAELNLNDIKFSGVTLRK